jgi:hypothetical protein
MAWKRTIVTSIAGGTATATIQMPQSGKISKAIMSAVSAAAGSWELSKSSTSQIATTSPDTGVLARMRFGATAAGNVVNTFELGVPVKVLDNIYLHCTGAGNVGELNLIIE